VWSQKTAASASKMTTRPNADRCPACGGAEGGIFSTQYRPVPGAPIEMRAPRRPPMVYQAPRWPIERLAPLLLKFSLSPGTIASLRVNLNPTGMGPFLSLHRQAARGRFMAHSPAPFRSGSRESRVKHLLTPAEAENGRKALDPAGHSNPRP
jgi:hypothetical protein